jgi:hypothetical protein
MLIEYRVEVKNGAVTITQHIELAGATLVTPQQTPEEKKPQTEPGKVSVLDLPDSFGVQKTPSAKDQSGGGPHDTAGPGGGGPGQGLVIVFGPVVVSPSGGPGSGGGGHDPAAPGGGKDQKTAAV